MEAPTNLPKLPLTDALDGTVTSVKYWFHTADCGHPRTQRKPVSCHDLKESGNRRDLKPRMACRTAWLIQTHSRARRARSQDMNAAEHYLATACARCGESGCCLANIADKQRILLLLPANDTMSSYACDRLMHTPDACDGWCFLKAWFIALPFAAVMGRDALTSILLKHDVQRRQRLQTHSVPGSAQLHSC